MKLKLESSNTSLKDQFEQNRELYISILVLVSSALLFIFFVLPNVIDLPISLNERNEEVEKLNKIKDAEKILVAADSNLLDAEIEVVTKALPSEKNFEIVLGAISEAATRSNVQVTGYKFSDTPNLKKSSPDTVPSLIFEINLIGGVEEAADFADQLLTTYPVSDIKEISYEKGISTITVTFFYKPFTSVESQEVSLARNKTDPERKIYEEISNWNLFNPNLDFLEQAILIEDLGEESSEDEDEEDIEIIEEIIDEDTLDDLEEEN